MSVDDVVPAPGVDAAPLVSVRGLTTSFPDGRGGRLRAVNDVSLDLPRRGTVGVVGESGSGKSVLLRSILGLIDPPGRIEHGTIQYGEHRLDQASERTFRNIRGREISTVFQNPAGALNPILPIRRQFYETIQLHEKVSRDVAEQRARTLLADVGFESPDDVLRARPFRLSGGVVQRVLIALALVHRPKLILADEPTTNLDVTVEAQILASLARIQELYATTILIVSHDMGVVSQVSDEIVVMYAGSIVERGSTEAILTRPAHPYTRALIKSVPGTDVGRGTRLPTIAGAPPDLSLLGEGCAFASRCEFASPTCHTQTPSLTSGRSTKRACHHALDVRTEAHAV